VCFVEKVVERWVGNRRMGRIVLPHQGLTANICNRGKTPGQFSSGRLSTTADEVRQVWNERLARDAEAVAKIVPECNAELGCGTHQSEECVAAVAASGATSAPTDLAFGDMKPDVALGAVGMERYLRSIDSGAASLAVSYCSIAPRSVRMSHPSALVQGRKSSWASSRI
jgi:hypothetical protein